MLSTRQKINAINKVIKGLLEEGVYPTLYDIVERLKPYSRRGWGRPQAVLRPAIDGQKIGGEDGRDIERTYDEIRDDLITYMNELVGSADAILSNYWMFEARKDILKRRLMHLIQAAESNITASALGGKAVFRDTFNNAELVDLAKTTAELNLDGGYVTLPASLNALQPVSISSASVTSESYPNTKPHGKITDALTDAGNTGWYASLEGGVYTCIIRLASSTKEVNGLYINPLAPMHVAISYSNDNYNFYPFQEPINETIRQERSWTFKPVKIASLKIEITGKDVGIKQLKLMSIGFEERARLESVVHQARDLFGNVVPIDSVSLEVDSHCPPQTDIQYYVQPIYAGADLPGSWTKIGNKPTFLSSSNIVTMTMSGNGSTNPFRPETTTGDVSRFYIAAVKDNPVVESSRMIKGGDPNGGGLGQLFLEYAEHDWEKVDLDPNHTPTPEDWYTFGAVSSGYIRPITQDANAMKAMESAADPLQTCYTELAIRNNCICEATTLEGISDARRDWLTIGIIGGTIPRQPGNKMLASNGNYRITTYVYTPQDMVLADKPCLLYNPIDEGGEGSPVIAPFRIYLNDELVADVREAWSGNITGDDLTAYGVTYAYKAGWNKLEILIHYTGRTSADNAALPVGQKIANRGVGIYIAGNPYQLARENPAIKVQAHPTEIKRVSEFALRQLVRPGDETCWAWTDTAPERDIILNYNPLTTTSSELFDGFNRYESPTLTLTYYKPPTERPIGLRFRADLSKEPGAPGLPKLHCYKLIINRTGG